VPPREYAEARHQMAAPVEPARHPAEDAVAAAAVAETLERPADEVARAVFALPETRTWIPDEQIARQLYQAMSAAESSPLVLDERQRAERIEGLVRVSRGEAMRGPWRARLGRRLLDTAYFLARLGVTSGPGGGRDLAREAALCVAASRLVLDERFEPEDHPVARALFARLLPEPAPAPEQPDPGRLIVPP
jgi:hypothetical protein